MPASVGVTPGSIPEADSLRKAEGLQSGAKRGYVPPSADTREPDWAERRYPYDERKTWYVLRVTCGKKLDTRNVIDKENLFIPTIHVVELKNGKRVTIEKPLINNLLFVYAEKSVADGYVGGVAPPRLAYQYDHCRKNEYGRSTLMTIGYEEMMNFVRAASTGEADVRIVDGSRAIRYKSDDMVEITAGKFKGVRGRVARLAGQQRVVVRLEILLNFATTYIPSCFLKKVGKP